MAVTVKVRLTVFCYLTECSPVYTLRGLVLYLEDAGNTFRRNAGKNKLQSDSMMSYLKRQPSEPLLLTSNCVCLICLYAHNITRVNRASLC